MELEDKQKAPIAAVSYSGITRVEDNSFILTSIKYLADMMAFDFEMVIQSNDFQIPFTNLQIVSIC